MNNIDLHSISPTALGPLDDKLETSTMIQNSDLDVLRTERKAILGDVNNFFYLGAFFIGLSFVTHFPLSM